MAAKKKVDKSRGPIQKKSSGKLSFPKRISRFFSNLRNEIKRVIWPDRKKLIQSTLTVLMIILAAAFIIWAFDTLVSGIFSATGFYAPKTPIGTGG